METNADALSVYIQIASVIVPFILGGLGLLWQKHSDLKERVKVLEIELAQNKASDTEVRLALEKHWAKMEELVNAIKALEGDVRVLIERSTKQ